MCAESKSSAGRESGGSQETGPGRPRPSVKAEAEPRQGAPCGRWAEGGGNSFCGNAHMVIATEEYFPEFKKLSPLHFPWFQFQRNFNCKENFVFSLGGEGSAASNSHAWCRFFSKPRISTLWLRERRLGIGRRGGRDGVRRTPCFSRGLGRLGLQPGAPWPGSSQDLWCQPEHRRPGLQCQACFVLEPSGLV